MLLLRLIYFFPFVVAQTMLQTTVAWGRGCSPDALLYFSLCLLFFFKAPGEEATRECLPLRRALECSKAIYNVRRVDSEFFNREFRGCTGGGGSGIIHKLERLFSRIFAFKKWKLFISRFFFLFIARLIYISSKSINKSKNKENIIRGEREDR